MLPIGACTRRHPDPERDRVGRVGRNGGDSAEQQSGKGNEAASAGNGIERAAERASEEQEDGGVKSQIQDVSRLASCE